MNKAKTILGFTEWCKENESQKQTTKKYTKYINQEISNSKEKIISDVKNDLNPKDLEYSLDDHLVDMTIDGSYNALLEHIGFVISSATEQLANKYDGFKNHIVKQVDKVVSEAWNQSKSEYKSATINNDLALPKDNKPE